MVKYFRDGIDEILDGGVDLMFCNREEAELLTGETDPHAAAQRLLNCASTVAITLGKEGALIADSERQILQAFLFKRSILTAQAICLPVPCSTVLLRIWNLSKRVDSPV